VLVSALASGCAEPPDPGSPPDAGVDGGYPDRDATDVLPDRPADVPPDFDPGCHYDCFGFVACKDGVVTEWVHAPVPCAQWNGECPHRQVGQCQRGCGAERMDHRFEPCPLTICREHYPKAVGDGCQEDGDCRPTRALPTTEADTADGGAADAGGTGVRQTYLRCDQDSGRCVERAAPIVPDWLGPCDPAVLRPLDEGAYGAAIDSSCTGGRCLVLVPHDRSCIWQGCSKSCVSDDDCPQGAVCQEAPAVACGVSTDLKGYCKPGPLNQIGIGLTCR
jgi:hypothetical protein